MTTPLECCIFAARLPSGKERGKGRSKSRDNRKDREGRDNREIGTIGAVGTIRDNREVTNP